MTFERAINQEMHLCILAEEEAEASGRMKEYRQVPAAVEFIGDRKARVQASLSNPKPDAEEVLLLSREKLGQYSSLSLHPLISHTQQKH